ncbi:hypothetical protein OE88DRAFT_1664351 [Heliocybe sulcata]|uniref:RanBD1 domain-containing protein n=1 Tax=Heliocybe sulcata TaxID=5364 RepID=A0A5C3MU87_9AGAM|nr:hypothetical protein OE88DRAFT_1664351 [Heliocybe sulcata]
MTDDVHDAMENGQAAGSMTEDVSTIDMPDSEVPRKREREISIEPSTPRPNDPDDEPDDAEKKPTPRRAKKKRSHELEGTEEVQEDSMSQSSGSQSPPLSTSPPHEVKMRQISQGVEDIDMKRSLQATPNTMEEAPVLPLTPEPEEGSTPTDETPAPSLAVEPPSSVRQSPESDTEQDADKVDLKRKMADRAASLEQEEPATKPRRDSVDSVTGAAKRPREDADQDDNPRLMKRPTPPPTEDDQPTKQAITPPAVPTRPHTPKADPAPKLSGFMAYASTSSPFASVKGASVFAAKATVPASPFSSGRSSPTPAVSKHTTPPPHTPAKRSGFEAFASAASPFASVARAKSPTHAFGSPSGIGGGLSRSKSPMGRTPTLANSDAFSSYATATSAFAVPASKRARADSPNQVNPLDAGVENQQEEEEDKDVSFSERLRQSRDDQNTQDDEDEWTSKNKLDLSEQDLTTGEEDEETIQQVRGKLFVLSSQSQWKERGTGTLRLNVRRDDGTGARLLMRKEAVFTVILNITLFKGMSCFLAQDPRYLRFSAIEDGKATHYNLRVPNAKIAQELLETINSNIPDA